MSNLIQRFDPSDSSLLDPSGKGVIVTNGHNPGEQLVLYNSSLTCFILTFLDKSVDVMPPSWARSFKKPGAIGNVTYQPLFTLSLLSGAQPISTCYGTIYESYETVADLNVPLSYVTNVGNPGGLSLSTNTVDNEGNAGSTQWLKVVPSDTALQTWQGLVDGTFVLQLDRAGTLFQVIATNPGAAPGVTSLTIGEFARTTEVRGVLRIDNLVNNKTPETIINGITAGTITVKNWMEGNRIFTDLIFQGYQNSPAPQQQISLPIRYTTGAQIRTGGIGNPNTKGIFKFTDGAGGAAVNVEIPSSLTGGAHTTQTNVPAFVPFGEVKGAFDTVWVDGSYTSPTGYAEMQIVGY